MSGQTPTVPNTGHPKCVIQQKQSIGLDKITETAPAEKHLKTAKGELPSPPSHCFLTDIQLLLLPLDVSIHPR